MESDISRESNVIWVARTASQLGWVALPPDVATTADATQVAVVRDATMALHVARLIGPVAGEAPTSAPWTLVGRYTISPAGSPLGELPGGVSPIQAPVDGHDWGALGLPDGLRTQVRPVSDPGTGMDDTDEVETAFRSAGYASFVDRPDLAIAPGDEVSVDMGSGIAIAVDRRKRTVEIAFADGESEWVAFDEIRALRNPSEPQG